MSRIQRRVSAGPDESELEKVIKWAVMQKCRCGEPIVHRQEAFDPRGELIYHREDKQKKQVRLRRVNTKSGGQLWAAD